MKRIRIGLREMGHLMRTSPLTTPLRLVYWSLSGNLNQKLKYHRARRIILASGLFDEVYYLRRNPSVTIEPLHHYLIAGAAEGYNPCSLFESDYYISQRPSLAPFAGNPLLHYIQTGAAQGRDPHPLFSVSSYLHRYPDVANKGIEPLKHYLTTGSREGRSPHPLIDSSFYLEKNPDVASSGMNPLLHFIEFGAAEGRSPCPLFEVDFYKSQQPDLVSFAGNPLLHYIQVGAAAGLDPHPLFSSSFYLNRYPDVAAAGVNPLQHYFAFGARERGDPHSLFDSSFYLESYPDLAATGINLLMHYLEKGCREGSTPHWMFDPAFYLKQNPGIASSGTNPLVHFIEKGARDLCDPHPLFDCSFYLSTQLEAKRSGMNPLEHFVRIGALEGRSPHFLFDFSAYMKMHPELKDFPAAAKHAAKAVLFRFGRSPQHEVTPMSRFIQNHTIPAYDAHRLSISVVIPTHNRVDVLEGTLQRCLQVSRHLPVDFVIVSDGSTDGTLNCLLWYSRHYENLRFVAIEKSGPATARNVGAAKSQGDLIMFMGDDIRPVDSEFFMAHMRAHEKLSDTGTIVEGHVGWPSEAGFQVNAVMRLIQGSGAQQFAYDRMRPHEFYDWRFFWTANISVKRSLVGDWSRDGFNPDFGKAAYEDVEFAYRTSKLHPNLQIFYAAESVGEHFHPYCLASFIKRQISAGEMARKLVDLHPELASVIEVEELDTALRTLKSNPTDAALLPEFEDVIQGIKSWGAIMETHQDLGTQEWQDAYLNALFQLCHGEGYLNTFRADGGNLAEGYRVLLRRFQQQFATSRSLVPIIHTIALS